MRLLIAIALTTLIGCSGGGSSDSPSTPTTPGAGGGGSTDPAKGTRLRTRCEEYTKVIFYADGSGGEYREEFPEDEACGWTDVTITMVKDVGDRWDPVVLTYEPADVEITAELPEPAKDWARIEIGDGRIELYANRTDASTSLLVTTPFTETEYFRFTLVREPRCERVEIATGEYQDCIPHNVTSSYPSRGHIYYGEDDDRMVDLEIVYYVWDDNCTPMGDFGRVVDECSEDAWGAGEREQALSEIQFMQDILNKSGVYINLVPVKVRKAYFAGSAEFGADFPTDVIIFSGGPADINPDGSRRCGEAGFDARFTRPLIVWSACGPKITLHELGHTLGLAHGPLNPAEPGVGYIFPDFGHGAYRVCGSYDDVMSYGNKSLFSNSALNCADIFPSSTGGGSIGSGGVPDQPAGIRGPQGYDTAYAINRVRYDASLINDERKVEND